MIHLPNGYALDADEHCFIVGKPRTRPDKGVVLERARYYPNVAQAISSTLTQMMRQAVAVGSITTLKDFIVEQERLTAELQALIAPSSCGQARQSPVDGFAARSEGVDTSKAIASVVRPSTTLFQSKDQ